MSWRQRDFSARCSSVVAQVFVFVEVGGVKENGDEVGGDENRWGRGICDFAVKIGDDGDNDFSG